MEQVNNGETGWASPRTVCTIVFVGLGCSNGHPRRGVGGFTTDVYVPQFQRWEVQGQGGQAPSVLVRVLFLVCRRLFFAVSSHSREKERDQVSSPPFTRAHIPFTGAPPSGPNRLTKAPPANTITLRVRIGTYEWWGSRHNQSVAIFASSL